MEAINNLTTFIIAGILLNLTPGQDTIYILGRSIAQGRMAGVISVLGISSGGLIHTMAAALGLSAILMTSAIVFSIIKYIGAGYLVYLGVRLFLNRKGRNDLFINAEPTHSRYKTIYKQGIITSILNPKTAIFFLAFLPQFINPTHAKDPLPFLILGGIFLTTGTIWCMIIAIFSSYATKALREKSGIKKFMEKISGGIFVLLGLKLAFEKN